MIADILHQLVKANLAAGLAVAAILPIRPVARRWLGAQTTYALWLTPLLAAAGALWPARKVVLLQTAALPLSHAIHQTFVATDYSPLLFGLWIAGVALSLAILAERQRRFKASLGRLTLGPEGALLAERNGGPAVFGVFMPRVVLPADFNTRFSAGERQAILAHERGHLIAWHAQTNGLLALAQCLCWFNPFAHIAQRALRLDQELACDAAVLSRSATAPRLYGEALLRAQLNAPPLPLGCYWPSTGLTSLKERLLMLKKPLPSRGLRLAGAGLISLVAGGAAVAAWAAQPDQIKVIDPVAVHQPAKTVTGPTDHGQSLVEVAQAAPQVSTSNSATPPAAAPSASAQSSVSQPDWLEPPSGADLATLYPPGAVQQEKTGKVTLRCVVTETGAVDNCAVIEEAPLGMGFGDAALAMTDKFKMNLTTKEGSPTAGAVVNIPVRFALSLDPKDPSS